jgi:hypothetical protein
MKSDANTLKILCGCALATLWAGSVLGQSASTLTDGAKWESSAAFGLTVTQGNSDTVLSTLNLTSARKWESNEVVVHGGMAYGEADSKANTDNQRLSAQYNRLLFERGFFYGRSEVFRDAVAELDYRLTVSPGGGYYFWRDDETGFVRSELGPGYVLEDKGGFLEHRYSLRAAERFEYRLNGSVKLWQSLECLPEVADFADFRVLAEIGVEAKLMKELSLRTFLQDAYDSRPARNRDSNELKLVTQVAYRF